MLRTLVLHGGNCYAIAAKDRPEAANVGKTVKQESARMHPGENVKKARNPSAITLARAGSKR